MKIAPKIKICVVRVVRDPKDLNEVSENVAAVSFYKMSRAGCRKGDYIYILFLTTLQAIKWAQLIYKADIIFMSFGYIDC